MVRRRDNGLWDLPGGRVEVGVATEDAARRELHEDTGMTAGPLRLLGVFSGPDTLHTYPDGNVVAWVSVLYLCREFAGGVRAADDAAGVCWCAPDAPAGGTGPATAAYLRLLLTPDLQTPGVQAYCVGGPAPVDRFKFPRTAHHPDRYDGPPVRVLSGIYNGTGRSRAAGCSGLGGRRAVGQVWSGPPGHQP